MKYNRRENDRRKGRDIFMVVNRGQKSDRKETGAKDRKKPVRVIVKPVYAGKQDMSEVFGNVALDNLRRKMQEG